MTLRMFELYTLLLKYGWKVGEYAIKEDGRLWIVLYRPNISREDLERWLVV